MGAAVADLSAPGFHYPPENAVTIFLVIWSPPHRPKPKVPIKLGRRVTVRHRIIIHGTGIVPARYLTDSPQPTVGNIGVRRVRFRLGTPLRTDLNRYLVLIGCGNHRLSLV